MSRPLHFPQKNLQRSETELKNLFQIFQQYAQKNISEFQEKGIRTRFFGNTTLLPGSLQKAFLQMEEETQKGRRMDLNICVAYGGRDEIVRAAEKLHRLNEEWTEEGLAKKLDSSPSPDIDLLIRTGGKSRISNFMLWKLAYAELCFYEKMWPEFSEEDLNEAILFYQDQKRTFGR
jgi:undecaprenyl diphosphate synthase